MLRRAKKTGYGYVDGRIAFIQELRAFNEPGVLILKLQSNEKKRAGKQGFFHSNSLLEYHSHVFSFNCILHSYHISTMNKAGHYE